MKTRQVKHPWELINKKVTRTFSGTVSNESSELSESEILKKLSPSEIMEEYRWSQYRRGVHEKNTFMYALKKNWRVMMYANEQNKSNLEVLHCFIDSYSVRDECYEKDFVKHEMILDGKLISKTVFQFHFEFLQKNTVFLGSLDLMLKAVEDRKLCRLLEFCSDDVRSNKELFITAVKTVPEVFRFATSELRRDKDVIIEASRRDSSVLRFVDNENNVLTDVDVVEKSLEYSWTALKYLPKSEHVQKRVLLRSRKKPWKSLLHEDWRHFLGDEDIVLSSIQYSVSSLRHSIDEEWVVRSMRLRRSRRELKKLKKSDDPSFDEKNGLFETELERNHFDFSDSMSLLSPRDMEPKILEFIHPHLKESKSFARKVCQICGLGLMHFSESVRGERSIVEMAVVENADSLQYATEEVRRDREFMLSLLRRNGLALKHATEGFKKDEVMALEAVRSNGLALEFVHDSIIITEENGIVRASVENNPLSIRFWSQVGPPSSEKYPESIRYYLPQSDRMEDRRRHVLESLKRTGYFPLDRVNPLSVELFNIQERLDKDETQLDYLVDLAKHCDCILLHIACIEKMIKRRCHSQTVYAHPVLIRHDKHLIQRILSRNYRAFRYLKEEYRHDKMFVLENVVPILENVRPVETSEKSEEEKRISWICDRFKPDISDWYSPYRSGNHGMGFYDPDDAWKMGTISKKDDEAVMNAKPEEINLLKEIREEVEDAVRKIGSDRGPNNAHRYVKMYPRNMEVVLAAVKVDGLSLYFADRCMKSHYEVALYSAMNSPHALVHVDPKFKKLERFMIPIIEQHACAFLSASDSLQKDRRFVLNSVKKNGEVMRYLERDLWCDRAFVKEAIDLNPECLPYCEEDFRKCFRGGGGGNSRFVTVDWSDRESAIREVTRERSSISLVSPNLLEDKTFMLEIMTNRAKESAEYFEHSNIMMEDEGEDEEEETGGNEGTSEGGIQGKKYEVDAFGGTALHYAVARGDLSRVAYLVEEEKMDTTAQDVFGFTPILVAKWYGLSDILDYLCSRFEPHPLRYSPKSGKNMKDCKTEETKDSSSQIGNEGKKKPETPSRNKNQFVRPESDAKRGTMSVSYRIHEEVIEGGVEKTLQRAVTKHDKVSDLTHYIFLENEDRLKREKVREADLSIVSGGTFLRKGLTLERVGGTTPFKVFVRLFPRAVEKFGVVGLSKGTEFSMEDYNEVQKMESNATLSTWRNTGEWRVMGRGLSVECECRNEKCEWKEKDQIVTLRFGKFDIVDIYSGTKCGKCKGRIKQEMIRNVGLMQCKYKFRCVTSKYEVVLSPDWIKVGEPCWLEGKFNPASLNTESTSPEKYAKIVFIVERDNE